MYLKSIEIQGFKSFANKLNFEFHNGITAIVGPNGSGKSNVADAVRWVLGEQRIKQLRGAKMEDVIFAGTENRKALGFAYVAITLDNTDHQLDIDFEEVTVSRRLFRSGESEYMINGSICRLKDINELFYDTGIGKEGYSIIGQGQIDKILSGKPEERRELFDEAAGIVKYKRRKDLAVKKLEDERGNLVRINDIISELEKQVKPLEKQSEIAKIYLKLRDELKTYDINVFLLEINSIKEQLQKINDKYTIVEQELKDNNEKLDNTKLEYEKLDMFIDEINSKIDEKKAEYSSCLIQKEKYENEIKLLNEQINSAKINDEHLNQRIDDIKIEIANKESEKETNNKNKELILEKLGKALETQEDADQKANEITDRINGHLNDIEAAKTDIINILNEKSNVIAKKQRYLTMLEQINVRKNEINQKIEQYNNDKKSQEKVIAELEEEMKNINDKIIDMNNEVDNLNNDINTILSENKQLIRQNEQKQQQYHQENSKLEALKNMTERYDGYGNSIKKIMEYKESKPGIIGVVADIIKVEKEYEVAIETALGGNIQNIVTNNETTAKDVIEYLKKNKFGRATFLPLNNLSNKTGFSNERALSEKGVIGLACDLVTINKEYEAVAKYLLGRIVVVDNIDNALSLARKNNYTLRIVTLEGELMNAGGSITGGAFKNQSNLLGRRREIEEIEALLKTIIEDGNNIKKSIEANEAAYTIKKDEIEKLKLSLSEQYILQNTAKMNINQASNKKKEIINNYEDFNKENNEISNQMIDINGMKDDLDNQINNFIAKNKELEDKINALNEVVASEKLEEQDELKSHESQRLEFSTLTQKVEFIKETIDRLDSEIIKLNEEMKENLDNAQNSSIDVLKKVQEINKYENLFNETNDKSQELNELINSMVANKEEQTKEHKDFFNKREELSNTINTLDKEMFRLNSQRERLEETNEKQINYMWDEYELTYSAANELKNDELNNQSQLKKNIQSIKQQIKELGDVNVNSIDEYKEVAERYTFLSGQRDDLIKAENTLLKIIDELDTGMKKQFNEKFAQIKTEFNKVFKELFGGGTGTIELNEQEDVLEASITIISQPPGKKLQNMMQLSGGEKSLTAIALLFAIQNLKPSPFCLLDEIEAALDDSNVVRFAEYLHNLTKYTQFIVITHRRGTMTAADRLYGITMQEKGVSALVSVNLIEEQLEKEGQINE